jgi:hypothetical protein
MTRTATVGFSAIILIAWTLYRYSRVDRGQSGPVLREVSEPSDSAVVLPPVSGVWSNINLRSSVSTNVQTASPAVGATAAAGHPLQAKPDPDNARVGARAKELLARVALGFVGIDPDAEQYWVAAINDPNVSAEERHELIQALNEAGFSDPLHVTSDDLPLIASRIALIEELAPNAMDNANAAAFQETYRDLLGMFGSVTGSEPAALQSASEP